METNEENLEQKEGEFDPVGVEIQENDYPILYLFKIINGIFLFIIFIFMGFADFPFVLDAISILSIFLGFASLFVPAKKDVANIFKLLSLGMYLSAMVVYVSA